MAPDRPRRPAPTEAHVMRVQTSRRVLPHLLAALAALVLVLPAAAGASPGRAGNHMPAPGRNQFGRQAHRGGLGLTSESTLEGFAKALELGVTTLELDIQITEDGYAVVTHDRQVSNVKCDDTAPAFPGDPEFPYV